MESPDKPPERTELKDDVGLGVKGLGVKWLSTRCLSPGAKKKPPSWELPPLQLPSLSSESWEHSLGMKSADDRPRGLLRGLEAQLRVCAFRD